MSLNQNDIHIKQIKRKCATKGCRNTATYFVSRAGDNAGAPNLCPDCIKETYGIMTEGGIIDERVPAPELTEVIAKLDKILDTEDQYIVFDNGKITFSTSGDTVIDTKGFYVAIITASENGENTDQMAYQVGDDLPSTISQLNLPIIIADNRPITITSPGIGSSITFSTFKVDMTQYDEGTFDEGE